MRSCLHVHPVEENSVRSVVARALEHARRQQEIKPDNEVQDGGKQQVARRASEAADRRGSRRGSLRRSLGKLFSMKALMSNDDEVQDASAESIPQQQAQAPASATDDLGNPPELTAYVHKQGMRTSTAQLEVQPPVHFGR